VKIKNSNILIIIVMSLLLILAQLVRLDFGVNSNKSENKVVNEYSYVNSKKLTVNEKQKFSIKRDLILYDENMDLSLNNIKVVCDYLKLDYDVASISQNIDLSLYKTIIMLEQTVNEYINKLSIFDYVKNGGKLLYLSNGSMGETDLLIANAQEFGIIKVYDIKETNNIYFNTDVLIGTLGELNLINNETEDYNNFEYLEVDTEEEAIIHMEEISGSPIIWEKSSGNGKIMVINTGLYEYKENRAIIAGAYSMLQDLFAYPIINSEIIFIDDFPADYKSEHLLIRENYGRDFERFIKEIWWPDMISLGGIYNLVYTSAYIQTYNDNVVGPFDYNKSTDSTTSELVSELVKYGGEVSFHGYNHQSLLYKKSSADRIGYKPWSSEDKIVESIKKSISDFNNLYPNYTFYTYVPPSNLLDDRAIPAIIKAIPSLKVISGLYFGEADDFGRKIEDIMEQEIGINQYNLVELPRVTSGSFLNDNVKFRFSSLITLHGLVNHFIHPDDILDPHRSLNMLWKELYQETEGVVVYLDMTYPWLDKETATNASEKVRQTHYSEIYFDLNGSTLQIASDNFDKEVTLILVTDKEITSSINCVYEKIGLNRYLVTMLNNMVSLEVR